jgi:mannitol-1-phosphate/altronate dehydrogenase
VPADTVGESIQARWRRAGDGVDGIEGLVRDVAADTELWGTDLAAIPGFVDVVAEHLAAIREHGAVAAIEALGLAHVR